MFHAIYTHNLIGKISKKEIITLEDAWFLKMIVHRKKVNLGKAIVVRMIQVYQHKWNPNYGMALTKLFKRLKLDLKNQEDVRVLE